MMIKGQMRLLFAIYDLLYESNYHYLRDITVKCLNAATRDATYRDVLPRRAFTTPLSARRGAARGGLYLIALMFYRRLRPAASSLYISMPHE